MRCLKARRTTHHETLKELQVYKSALTLALSEWGRHCRPQQHFIACGLGCSPWYLESIWQNGHQRVRTIKTSLPKLGAIFGMLSPANVMQGIFMKLRKCSRTCSHTIKSHGCNKSDAGQTALIVKRECGSDWQGKPNGARMRPCSVVAFLKNETWGLCKR